MGAGPSPQSNRCDFRDHDEVLIQIDHGFTEDFHVRPEFNNYGTRDLRYRIFRGSWGPAKAGAQLTPVSAGKQAGEVKDF